ncbi:MAG: transporter substrate-binding domain-containing protein [Cellvibrionaceae bacterium]
MKKAAKYLFPLWFPLRLPLWLLLLGGCEPAIDSQSAAAPAAAPAPYTETGDLPALRERGKLRLIAPRFDGAEALPRDGIPVHDYQRIAEEFSNSLNLDVHWVYVDAFTDLIPTLNAGRGDVIVTNLTETVARREQVDFSQPIRRVNEVIVGPSDRDLANLRQLGDLTITVPEGSAYIDSLNSYNQSAEQPLVFNTIPSVSGEGELLTRIAEGAYQATVLDSDIAEVVVGSWPDLKIGATLREHRPIGWAVRRDNPLLLQALNQFLVSHFLSSTTYRQEPRDWEAIKNHGRIRMLTLNNPASYFMWRGDLIGFDYDLAKHFAQENDLHLSVVIKHSIPELISALQSGEGDFIAASMTRSSEREAQGLVFSDPYLRVSAQLVGRREGSTVSEPAELAGKRIGVNPDTVFYQQLQALQGDGIDLVLVEYPGVLTEALFRRLEMEEFDFMMADSHLVAMEQAYSDALAVNMELDAEAEIAWGLRADQPQLAAKLNEYIGQAYRGLFYNVTFNKYFVNERKSRTLQAERVTGGSGLSPYDDIVQALATRYGMDWRLLTAQMYQESRFDPDAKSFAGALGLMQVMPRTARELGFSNITEPQNGIEAGVAYLNWLSDRFPGDIDFQERIYFQLAAYNAGAGHVRDARRLALQLGYDANRWFDHVEKAMLLLEQPEYYKNARFGYVRGSEPVAYVRAIRGRYLAYLEQ